MYVVYMNRFYFLSIFLCSYIKNILSPKNKSDAIFDNKIKSFYQVN